MLYLYKVHTSINVSYILCLNDVTTNTNLYDLLSLCDYILYNNIVSLETVLVPMIDCIVTM